jgi:16S rRNA (guanine966-N2)-methyltransferase
MRITGGRWRSRALEAPRGTTTRPTSDRVREALFSMLVSDGHLGDDAAPRVLDLYAGSGALAFEALSRGAVSAVLVEQARDALAAIRENAQALDATSLVRVVAGKVDRSLEKLDGPFGIVFADPPYADVRSPAFAGILAAAARLLGPGGALVLEHASADPPPEVAGLMLDRSRRHGDTTLTLYVRTSNPGPGQDPGRDAL